jgi:hypothetical protein
MTVQRFAAVIGTLFLIVGILGFIPAFRSAGPSEGAGLTVQTGYSYLLGLFAVNVLHNMVHLGVGLWGLLSSGTMVSSIRFARGLAILYGVLAVMGLIPGLNTLFGLAPLFGHDVWLHAGTALLSAYYGYYWTPAVIEADRRDTRRAA